MGIISGLVTVIERALESFGDPTEDEITALSMRRARDRAAELAVEKLRLEDEVERMTKELNELQDRYVFNGPTLYKDEIEALQSAILMLKYLNPFESDALSRLLSRSDHFPETAQALQDTIYGIVNGTIQTFPWDVSDVRDGNAVFDPDLVPADDDSCFSEFSEELTRLAAKTLNESGLKRDACSECHDSPRPRMATDACVSCGNVGRDLGGGSF